MKTQVLLSLAIITTLLGTVGAVDPINVVAIGMVAPGSSPIPGWLAVEPATDSTLVPNRYAVGVFETEDAKRMVRIYFPRTQERLSNYDVIIFSGGNIRGFDLTQVAMIKSAVSKGMAAITDIGGVSSDSGLWGDWLASGIDAIFPNDVRATTSGLYRDDMPFRVKVVESSEIGDVLRMFIPLGIEEVLGMNAYRMVPLQGVKIWAETRGNWPSIDPRPPWLMSWNYGKGFSWAIADAFTFEFWSSYQTIITGKGWESTNQYSLDIFMNLILEGTGRNLPHDILLVHQARQNLRLYHDTRSTLYEVINFLEQFGANTNSLNIRIAEIEEKRVLAEEAYLSQDFTLSKDLILEALEDSNEIRDGIEDLRKRTMFWIFLTEWSIVSATMIIAGTFVYWLMVRRRLYKEVSVTKGV